MARLTQRGAARLRSARGAELVELALVFPLLLLFVAGVIDAGLFMQQYAVVSNAAREGARVAAIPGWIEDDVKARVNDYLAAGGLDAAAATTTVTPVSVTAGAHTLSAVKVVVSYPYNYLWFGSMVGWFQGTATPLTLAAAATMRTEVMAGL